MGEIDRGRKGGREGGREADCEERMANMNSKTIDTRNEE